MNSIAASRTHIRRSDGVINKPILHCKKPSVTPHRTVSYTYIDAELTPPVPDADSLNEHQRELMAALGTRWKDFWSDNFSEELSTESDSDRDAFMPTAPKDRANDAGAENRRANNSAAMEHPRTAEQDRPVKARDVAGLVAATLTFPLRATVGAFMMPVVWGAQAITSLGWAGERKRLDESRSAYGWTSSNGGAQELKRFGQRVILQGPASEDRGGGISLSVKVLQNVHAIDRVVAAESLFGQYAKPTILSDLTLASRLDVIAHGSPNTLSGKHAFDFAWSLFNAGLRKVGVIKIDSCYSASETFIDEVGYHLDKFGIRFGWIAGNMEDVGDLRRLAKFGNYTYHWTPLAMPWQKFSGVWMPECLNRRILKGNANVNFSGTVYDANKPFWRVASDYSPFH